MVHPCHKILTSKKKKMSKKELFGHATTRQIPRELCWVKKPIQNVWFHLHQPWKDKIIETGGQTNHCQGLRKHWVQGEGGVAIKGQHWRSYGDRSILHLDYHNANVLILVLYYNFSRC